MPDPNNPLETALRSIKDIILLTVRNPEFFNVETDDGRKRVMTLIRAEMVNYRNLELEKRSGKGEETQTPSRSCAETNSGTEEQEEVQAQA